MVSDPQGLAYYTLDGLSRLYRRLARRAMAFNEALAIDIEQQWWALRGVNANSSVTCRGQLAEMARRAARAILMRIVCATFRSRVPSR
jgi:hypothetical protein